MPLINVKLIEDVFTSEQKGQIVERLTDAMVSIEGENMRGVSWVVVEEVQSGDWHRRPAAAHRGRQGARRRRDRLTRAHVNSAGARHPHRAPAIERKSSRRPSWERPHEHLRFHDRCAVKCGKPRVRPTRKGVSSSLGGLVTQVRRNYT